MAGPGVGHSLGPYATDFPWRTWKTNKTPFFQKTKKHESSVPGRRLFPAEARARLGFARGRPGAERQRVGRTMPPEGERDPSPRSAVKPPSAPAHGTRGCGLATPLAVFTAQGQRAEGTV